MDWTKLASLHDKYLPPTRQAIAYNPKGSMWVIDTEEFGPLLLKRASAFAPLRDFALAAQRPFGGPTPLTAAMLSAALMGSLGYGGGWLSKKLFPEYIDESAERKFGLLGALGGAAIPLVIHGIPNIKHYGWQGLFKSSPLQGGDSYPNPPTRDPAPPPPEPPASPPPEPPAPPPASNTSKPTKYQLDQSIKEEPSSTKVGSANADIAWILQQLQPQRPSGILDPMRFGATGGLGVPNVNVNEWGDVIRKDPFMSLPEKTLVGGLPIGAALANQSQWVSPIDVGRFALNAGLGYGTGKVIGLLAQKILPLNDRAVEDLSRAGMLAGIFKTIGVI